MKRRPHHPLLAPSTRRRFLAGSAALGAAWLSGCGSSGGVSTIDLGGDRRVRILNWADYIDPDGTIADVEAELGIQVSYEATYEDNLAAWDDLFLPALGRGSTLEYDIVVPTYWLVARLVERGWLEQIPLEIVPNHVNIEPAYLTESWDRGGRYHMPWQAGLTGIVYDPARTGRPVNSIADLFDPAFRGRVGIIGEMRETVPLGMLLNGDDPSRPEPATASAGLQLFEDARASGQIAQVTFGDFADGLTTGDLAIAMAWSGDTVQLQIDRPDIEFVIPDEGAVRWFDSMVIPAGSPNVAAAGAWMNYVYDPVNAARITSYVQYISPVVGVREELDRLGGEAATLARNPILFPDEETNRRLFTWGGLPVDVETELDERFNALF